MQYYFAPLEGFTTYSYRRTHHRFFPGTDRYYTPFISTNQNFVLPRHDLRELDPANNPGIRLIPQLLSKNAEQFAATAEKLFLLGYPEINLNLGCPSSTVVPKGKGAGMLKDPENLDRFFAEVFSYPGMEKLKISVKTRIGFADPEERTALLEIFNRYPLSELIIHPRTQKEFYAGHASRDAFLDMFGKCTHPAVYNGDLKSAEDCREISALCPGISAVMIGRGLLADPALVREAKGGPPLEKKEYLVFLEALYEDYKKEYRSERNAMCKMKDLWKFAAAAFSENKSAFRAIQKSRTGSEYVGAVTRFFESSDLLS